MRECSCFYKTPLFEERGTARKRGGEFSKQPPLKRRGTIACDGGELILEYALAYGHELKFINKLDSEKINFPPFR